MYAHVSPSFEVRSCPRRLRRQFLDTHGRSGWTGSEKSTDLSISKRNVVSPDERVSLGVSSADFVPLAGCYVQQRRMSLTFSSLYSQLEFLTQPFIQDGLQQQRDDMALSIEEITLSQLPSHLLP